MKCIYSPKKWVVLLFFLPGFFAKAQSPTLVTFGVCDGVVANFNTNDNGFNSPSVYAGMFDSSFYFHSGRGYWTDYLPPLRVNAPGFPRVLNIISPPYMNPNPVTTFTVGFYYIVNNPLVDRFQVRIISMTSTPMGTVSNIEASSGVITFQAGSRGPITEYLTDTGPDPTPFMVGFQGNVCIRLIDADITNGPNTTYRVEVAYIINAPTFVVFDNLSIGPITAPLPVDFIGLGATRNNSTVDLRWDVSDEVNVKEYQVEKSTNGSSFTTIGAVTASGQTIYSHSHLDENSATAFYRVKSMDIDGRFKYSGIVKLKGSAANSFSDNLLVYPVPAKEEVMVEHGKLEPGSRMLIMSADGRVLKSVIPTSGSSHTPVNISSLSPGIYFLKLEDGMGKIRTTKLIKD